MRESLQVNKKAAVKAAFLFLVPKAGLEHALISEIINKYVVD